MKRYIVVMACILAVGVSQNLLQNPGFEDWSGGMPDNWYKDDSVAIFQEDIITHGGNFSAKDSFFCTTGSESELYQGFYVQPSTQYTITFWAFDNDPAGRARAGVQWYENGNYISSDWTGNFYTEDSPNWQEWSYVLNPSPSNADSVRFIIRGYDVGSPWYCAVLYIDDAYFAQPSTQPPIINRVWHKPVNPDAGVTTDVYAYTFDNDGTIDADTLFYGVNDLTSPTKITHTSVTNDTFQYQIPVQTSGDTIFYFLKFVDNDGFDAISDTYAYYVGALNIYINEIRYDDQGSDDECFVELYGPGDMSLDGFTLVGVNGNGGYEYQAIDLTGYSIPSDGFFVIAQDNIVPNYDLVTEDVNYQNGPDNVELRFNNITIEALGYGELGTFVFTGEWKPAPDIIFDHCLCRYPDGSDTDNNFVDFKDNGTYTPGEPNTPGGIEEVIVCSNTFSVIKNPVVSGIKFAWIVNAPALYPITVYNILGRNVRKVLSPKTELDLSPGIYFLKLNNSEKRCAKLIVVR